MRTLKYGFSNCYYAKQISTDGKLCYADPVPLYGAISVALQPSFDILENRNHNGGLQTVFQKNNGYTGNITFAYIPSNFKVDILGASINNGIVVHRSTDQLCNFALLFETKGTVHTRYIFYNCYVKPTDVNFDTNADKIAHQNEKIMIVASPIISNDGNLNNTIYSEIENTQDNVDTYNNWLKTLPTIKGEIANGKDN